MRRGVDVPIDPSRLSKGGRWSYIHDLVTLVVPSKLDPFSLAISFFSIGAFFLTNSRFQMNLRSSSLGLRSVLQMVLICVGNANDD